MSSNILFFIESRDSEIKNVSFEAASAANQIASETGGKVIGVAVGSGLTNSLGDFGNYGVSEVISVDNSELAVYSSEGYSAALVHEINKLSPSHVVIPGSLMGKDLAPRVAVKTDSELMSDAVSFTISGGKLEVSKPVFAGKAIIKITSSSEIQLVAIRPKAFSIKKTDGGDCTVTTSDFDVSSVNFKTKVTSIVKGNDGKIDLTEADIIVSGGRGLQDPSNFDIIEKLASTVGGVVGASRAVVDAGWRPHSDQVGQTGKTVSPQLYIAVGISGAIQHLAGMSSSKFIVAINKDADAPIFKIADYGIVGDLFEVVPALTEELAKG